MINLAIADDLPLEMVGLKDLISKNPDFQIVGECQRIEELLKVIAQNRPDVLILALQITTRQVKELECWIRINSPSTHTILVMASQNDAQLSELIRSGIEGLTDRTVSEIELIGMVQKVASGGTAFSQNQLCRMENWEKVAGKKYRNLTYREIQILKLLARGYDNKRISHSLCISLKTTAFHVSNLLTKLNVNSRLAAVIWAEEYINDLHD